MEDKNLYQKVVEEIKEEEKYGIFDSPKKIAMECSDLKILDEGGQKVAAADKRAIENYKKIKARIERLIQESKEQVLKV